MSVEIKEKRTFSRPTSDTIDVQLEETVSHNKFRCSFCSKSFSKKLYLLWHVRTLHTMESKQLAVNSTSNIIEVQLEETASLNKFPCSFCSKSFSKKCNLLCHVRTLHTVESKQIAEKETSNISKVQLEKTASHKKFLCSFCSKSFVKKFNVLRHMRTCHAMESKQLSENEGKNTFSKFSCAFCRKEFATKYSLMRHIRSLHSNESIPPVKLSKSGNILCSICNKLFAKKFNLWRHMKTHNSNESFNLFAHKNKYNSFQHTHNNEKLSVTLAFNKCPLCKEIFKSSETSDHFEGIHGIKLKKSVLKFKSYDDFIVWKNEIEQESKSKFIRYGNKVTLTNGNTNFYFKCHRSGYFKSHGVGLRHLKLSGSNKIDAYCPASLKIIKSKEGDCTAYFQSTHVGHSNDLRHLSLTFEERQFLAEKIALKIPFDDILDSIQTSVGSDLQRLHLLTQKDLHNIVSSFNLSSSIIKHPKDYVKDSESSRVYEIINVKETCYKVDSAIKRNMCKNTHFLCSQRDATGNTNSNQTLIRNELPEPMIIDGKDPESEVILKELSEENNAQVHEQEQKSLMESYMNLIKSLETPEQYALMKQNLKSLVPKLNAIKTINTSKTFPKAAKIPGNGNITPRRMFHMTKRKKKSNNENIALYNICLDNVAISL